MFTANEPDMPSRWMPLRMRSYPSAKPKGRRVMRRLASYDPSSPQAIRRSRSPGSRPVEAPLLTMMQFSRFHNTSDAALPLDDRDLNTALRSGSLMDGSDFSESYSSFTGFEPCHPASPPEWYTNSQPGEFSGANQSFDAATWRTPDGAYGNGPFGNGGGASWLEPEGSGLVSFASTSLSFDYGSDSFSSLDGYSASSGDYMRTPYVKPQRLVADPVCQPSQAAEQTAFILRSIIAGETSSSSGMMSDGAVRPDVPPRTLASRPRHPSGMHLQTPHLESQQLLTSAVRRSSRIAAQNASIPRSILAEETLRSSDTVPSDTVRLGPLPRLPASRLPRPSEVQKKENIWHCDDDQCVREIRPGEYVYKKSFTRRADLDRHKQDCHSEATERYVCKECGFRKVRKDKMWEHCRKMHNQGSSSYKIETEPWGLYRQRVPGTMTPSALSQ